MSCRHHNQTCPHWSLWLLGAVLYCCGAVFCMLCLCGLPMAAFDRLEKDAKQAKAQQEKRIKDEEIQRQKELEELYKARPEWGFKPK